jgi:hypothetical protein
MSMYSLKACGGVFVKKNSALGLHIEAARAVEFSRQLSLLTNGYIFMAKAQFKKV